jgi:YggT family protein
MQGGGWSGGRRVSRRARAALSRRPAGVLSRLEVRRLRAGASLAKRGREPEGTLSRMPFIQLILLLLDIYFWIIIAMVVMSWLVAFNVVNPTNTVVRQIRYALYRLTEPLLGPIRRFLPDLGGIDIAPVILLIALWFVQNLVITYGPQLVGA